MKYFGASAYSESSPEDKVRKEFEDEVKSVVDKCKELNKEEDREEYWKNNGECLKKLRQLKNIISKGKGKKGKKGKPHKYEKYQQEIQEQLIEQCNNDCYCVVMI